MHICVKCGNGYLKPYDCGRTGCFGKPIWTIKPEEVEKAAQKHLYKTDIKYQYSVIMMIEMYDLQVIDGQIQMVPNGTSRKFAEGVAKYVIEQQKQQ